MKQKLVFMITVLTFITFLAACEGSNEQSTLQLSKENVFALSAMSSIEMLDTVDRMELNDEETDVKADYDLEDDELQIFEQVQALVPYLGLIRLIDNQKDIFSFTQESSPLEDYELLIVLATSDINADHIEYELHYNEIIDQNHIDDESDEYDSLIEGVLLYNGKTFIVSGEREVEEDEEKFEFKAVLDAENYIIVETEFKDDGEEQESDMKIQYFKDGELFYSIEIELENEEKDEELELKIIQGTKVYQLEIEIEINGNTTEYEIEYKMEENGNTIDEGEVEITLTYNEETGDYHIDYKIESTNSNTIIISN